MAERQTIWIELPGGPKPLILRLNLSKKETTLDIREDDARSPKVRRLTERCFGLYGGPRGHGDLVGILLHLTKYFYRQIDGYKIIKVKHMTRACRTMDGATLDSKLFGRYMDVYDNIIDAWTKPYDNIVIPIHFAALLREVGK